ncbi:MAG: nodulation protein NfeD [bacterium]
MRGRYSVVPFFLFLLFCSFALLPAGGQSTDAATDSEAFYYHATVESSINPVTANYVVRAIEAAERDGAQALVLQLDTPGGLMDSMNKITKALLNSSVPVAVWVGPSGARAASAGVFITYASHYAAMAEGTRIGAAHPVSGQGQKMSEVMKEKVTNDAVAQLESIAKKRGRNQNLADSFVRHSISLTASEALQNNVIDSMQDDVAALLNELIGKKIPLGENSSVKLKDGPVKALPMTHKEDFLNTLANPNLVYILMMLGIYGLIYEFAEPGIGLGAVVGGICLLMALFGMSVLPVNYAGLGLVGLGIGLMILDVFVPSFGVLTLGGVTAFALGSVFLFETKVFSVSLGLIIGFTAATVTAVVVAGYLILGAFNLPDRMGEDALVGERGTAKSLLNPDGKVYVHGEYWTAESEDGAEIPKGETVEVTRKDNRTLIVKKA